MFYVKYELALLLFTANSFLRGLRTTVNLLILSTVELHVSGLMWTPSHPDMQKVRIIGFFFENRLHWQFEVRLLLFAVCTYV